jgi:hypothetical protein
MSIGDEWSRVDDPEEESSDSDTEWVVPGIIPADDGLADEWVED